MRWIVGSDHAGWGLKRHLCEVLRELGDEVVDLGTDNEASVDYPDYGAAVGRAVASARAPTLGLVICGTGIGISIAANKVPGIRAALCTEAFSATAARAHNDANVLSMGGRIVADGLATEILTLWLATPFEGGRHERRLAQITDIESSNTERPATPS